MKGNSNFILSLTIISSLLCVGTAYSQVEKNTKKITVTGNFKSIKGAMKELSCYCYNSGYLTTNDNKVIPVCLSSNNIKVDCTNVKFTGYYETKEIKPNKNDVCPSGKMTYLKVVSHKCK